MCPGLSVHLNWAPGVECSKLLYLVYKFIEPFSSFPFQYVKFRQSVPHRGGWSNIELRFPHSLHSGHHKVAHPHTRVGALQALLARHVGAGVECLSAEFVGRSRVLPSVLYTFWAQPFVVSVECTPQHQPVDQLEAVYGIVLPSLQGPVIPSGVDVVGLSGGACLALE